MGKMDEAISTLDDRINKSEILTYLIKDCCREDNIDYSNYISMGYSEQEINIGCQLIHLYLKLKEQYNILIESEKASQ